MRPRIPHIADGALWLATSLGVPAWGADLAYHVRVGDRNPGTLEIVVQLEHYPFDRATFLLARPPVDAATYFRFFDRVELSKPSGEPLAADVHAPGVHGVYVGDAGVVLSYRVHVGELTAALERHERLPVIDAEGAVLPLGALLAFPEELDAEGAPVDTLRLVIEDPGRPLRAAWRTESGVATFEGAAGRELLRTGIAVTGSAHVVDRRDREPPAFVVVRGGDAALAERSGALVSSIASRIERWLGRRGREPISAVVELDDTRTGAEVVGAGAFLRISAPSAFFTRGDVLPSFGSPLYAFRHALAHEMFHRWIGVAGLARPSGAGARWLSEGAAEYLATVALVTLQLAPRESALEAIASLVERLAEMPDRADPLGPERGGNAVRREMAFAKAPLVCFLIDVELLATDPDLTLERALAALLDRVLGDCGEGAPFTGEDLAAVLGAAIGADDPVGLLRFGADDLTPLVPSRAERVGIEWIEGGRGIELRLVDGSAYARRLAPIR